MALQKAVKNGATPFKFVNSGDTLKGYYQGQSEKVINGRKAVEHTYKTRDGRVSVLGQANILNQLENNGIIPGTYVEITYTGETMRLKSGNVMKVYDISFDLDDSDTQLSTGESDDEMSEIDAEEVRPAAPSLPRSPAKTPSATQRAQVQSLLSSKRS